MVLGGPEGDADFNTAPLFCGTPGQAPPVTNPDGSPHGVKNAVGLKALAASPPRALATEPPAPAPQVPVICLPSAPKQATPPSPEGPPSQPFSCQLFENERGKVLGGAIQPFPADRRGEPTEGNSELRNSDAAPNVF